MTPTPTPTPRTDAAEILWNDTGLCVVSAEFARYLERELADKAESLAFQTQLNRELIEREKQTFAELTTEREQVAMWKREANRLADELDHAQYIYDLLTGEMIQRVPAHDESLAAWKEARSGTV
jgi:cell shape-determining protein MreC